MGIFTLYTFYSLSIYNLLNIYIILWPNMYKLHKLPHHLYIFVVFILNSLIYISYKL